MNAWIAYCDGTAMPNPGRIGLGAVLTAPDGTRHILSQTTRDPGCNNEAEARALLATLQELQRRGAATLRVHCDNSVVVEQVCGNAARPIPRLAGLFAEVRTLLDSFDQATLVWIPRHRNGEADALARAALGLPARPAARACKQRR